jgi:hypothetical protein
MGNNCKGHCYVVNENIIENIVSKKKGYYNYITLSNQ